MDVTILSPVRQFKPLETVLIPSVVFRVMMISESDLALMNSATLV
jgi:hypothetical protein